MKVCSKCKVEKPETEFWKTFHRCKPCVTVYQKKYREENKDKYVRDSAQNKKYNDRKKEYRKNYYRVYNQGKKETLSVYHKEYFKEWSMVNKEKLKKKSLKWHRNQKENLTDTYVRGVLIRTTNLTKEEINEMPQLIELKRLQIKLKTKTNEAKQRITGKGVNGNSSDPTKINI